MPSVLTGLGVEWFAQALDAPVIAAEVEPVSFTGATTELARVRLAYGDDGTGPATVIAKITGRGLGDAILRRALHHVADIDAFGAL